MISRMMGRGKSPKSTSTTETGTAPDVAPGTVAGAVTAVLLEDADESFTDGRLVHVGEDGVLDLGDQDHILGLDSEVIHAFPSYTFEEAVKDEPTTCPICQEPYAQGDQLKELPCQHRIHEGCIEKWLEVSVNCPVCNQSLQ
ncbi:unnamed protein product [Durusdinium trenchii]|uniref:RING-type domain-containing protein n=2 Tax=Durusdinium trenchii TaxID=1381693 RepID=A0ABP0R1R5_9DINO